MKRRGKVDGTECFAADGGGTKASLFFLSAETSTEIAVFYRGLALIRQ